ncbi:hypothetical protein ABEB36_003433 [Hypothenemus hampei]|uniref:F-box domain-containing protein n=1 Tax=Hypothenemus hampei TaxID=57062 RepID=A0ABD1F942_HYPHA
MECSGSCSAKIPSIDDLPEEVLEYILSLIAPYKDLHDSMLVSKKWRRCVKNVVKIRQRNFHKGISEFNVKWSVVNPDSKAPIISKRYSHSAAIHGHSMYIFGGCTSAMTTFNDLWLLDLTTRTWLRPFTTGSYPSPKACSSLVHYKDLLVLFGGWTYPPAYPLYQSWHLFNELHVYDITTKRWTNICTENNPPPMAGHSACVVGQWMIVFGGLQKPSTAVHCEKSNDIWKLNLETWVWHKQEVLAGPKPLGRFGQTQVMVNEKNLFILGGSGGPSSQYCDGWLLNMENSLWKWIKVELQGKANEPVNIWSNPGCKIGNKIVVLNRIRREDESPVVYYPRSHWTRSEPDDSRRSRIDIAIRPPDRDENVNGRRGDLRQLRKDPAESSGILPGPSEGSRTQPIDWSRRNAFMPPLLPTINPAQAKRTLMDMSMNEFYPHSSTSVSIQANKREKKMHYLGLYVLDLANVLEKNPIATWLPPNNLQNGPEETILYTLLEGNSELIMFGGILKEDYVI